MFGIEGLLKVTILARCCRNSLAQVSTFARCAPDGGGAHAHFRLRQGVWPQALEARLPAIGTRSVQWLEPGLPSSPFGCSSCVLRPVRLALCKTARPSDAA